MKQMERSNMERIWAPWRIEYILQEKDKGCIFCEKIKEKRDKKNYILYRGRLGFIIMNIFPYNSGHLMVAPYKHTADLGDLEEKELTELMVLVRESMGILRRALNPEGFNLGMNLGKCAGAGVIDHLHFHIVPRWQGDTNFMPLFSETQVMPELLESTYKKLKKEIKRCKF